MLDISKNRNVWMWYQRAKKTMAQYGYEEINQHGADIIGTLFRSKVK